METATAPAKPVETLGVDVKGMIDQILEDEDVRETKRVNLFADCVKDGSVTIPSEAHASEAARMILAAQDELTRTKAIAEAMVARVQARLSGLEFLFMAPLEVWTSARLVGAKKRSILLPGGKLGLRKIPGGTRYVNGDNKATMAWALEFLPAAIEMKPSLKTDKVVEWEMVTKTAAPGRETVAEHDSFSVSVPK